MATNKHRAEYEQRVNRVLDYIRDHHAEDLSLETLAEVAAFSPFHFHRIFQAMTGETVRELVLRLRLEAAATQLTSRPHVDILAIALDNGFSSASGFARAFKDRFGMTASAWRGGGAPYLRNGCQPDRKPGEVVRKAGTAAAGGDGQDASMVGDGADLEMEDPMNVTVKNLPAYHIAYMRNVGPYGPGSGVQDVWLRLQRWASARDLWTADRLCLGIALDNPMVTEPAKCRYDAAIVVPAGFAADGAVNVVDMAAGKYATSEFAGSSHEIGAAWSQLFGRWLPQSGYQPANQLCFELYKGEAWDGKTDAFRCDLCVPVQPL